MPYDDDDDDRPRSAPGKAQFFEFECPSCSATNPWPDGFKDREEIACHYCGQQYQARVSSEGKLKLKEV